VSYNNGWFGITAAGNNLFIVNNTIYNNADGVDCTSLSGGNIVNNIVLNSGSNVDTCSGQESNNLTTGSAGMFQNAPGGDFHLTANSPARDAGTSLPEVPCDYDGNARPAGSAYDIGAFEYGSSPGGGCSGSTSSPTPTPRPTNTGGACTQYTNQSQISQGFGVPWDVTNPSIMLVSAQCTPPTLLLKTGDPNTTQTLYVYKTVYVAPSGGSSWTPVDLFGSQLISQAWYPSSAQGVTNIPDQTKATFYVVVTNLLRPYFD
jgi:hypothetical protein